MLDLLVPCLVILVASLIQGFFGFGFGIVAMGTLSLIDDLVHASGVVNLTSILLVVAMVWREHERVLWPVVGRIVPSMLVGVVIGLAALRHLDRPLMVTLLGVTVIAVATWNILAPTLRHRESAPLDLLAGAVAGLMSGAFNTAGPALVIHLYRRPENPLALVVTLQAIFLVSGLFRAALATWQGLITAQIGFESLVAAPFVVLGAVVGGEAARRTNPQRFRRVAWMALGALGVALVVTR